jgi:hypothetical protein
MRAPISALTTGRCNWLPAQRECSQFKLLHRTSALPNPPTAIQQMIAVRQLDPKTKDHAAWSPVDKKTVHFMQVTSQINYLTPNAPNAIVAQVCCATP